MAYGANKRTKSSLEITASIGKLMNFQVSKWESGFRTDGYFLINKMDYQIVQTEEEFERRHNSTTMR